MHLVLGATGGIGHSVVENLVQRGENVRALVRDPSRVKDWSTGKVELVKGDALKIEDVTEASQGVTSIFHCVNVPYQEWNTKAIPMLENTIAAAKLNKAKIMFPGNVYVFGHVHTDTVGEDQPFAPHTAKGKLRVRMEQMLNQSWRSDSVPYTIVRFPDFYGPYVLNPLYGQIFQNALIGKPMRWYGRLDVPIEFCYIEDAAEALVTAGLSATTSGETYHVPGPGVTTPKEWLDEVRTVAGTQSKIRTTPGYVVTLAGIFNPLAREFREMLYLKEERLILNGTKFRTKFGGILATPYRDGIKKTIDWFKNQHPQIPS